MSGPNGIARALTIGLALGIGATAHSAANDDALSPQHIGTGGVAFDTRLATTDGNADVTSCANGEGGQLFADIWFLYEAPCDGFATASTCGTADFDTVIRVYEQGPGIPPPDSSIACDDNACFPHSEVAWPVTGGSQYLIRLGGSGLGRTGTGILLLVGPGCDPTAACCLIDGTCAELTPTSCLAAGGTPQGAGTNCGTTICADERGACCFNDGTCVDDLEANACTLAGGTYQGLGTDCLIATCAVISPPNDNCGSAFAVSSLPASVIGDTTLATLDNGLTCGPALTSPGVWFSVTGTGTQLVATTCESAIMPGSADFDSRISVFTGCGELVCITGNDDACAANGTNATAAFCTNLGDPYHILVSGFGAAQGAFELSIFDNGNNCGVGACCATDGTCSELTYPGCLASGGTYRGHNTSCSTVSCAAVAPNEIEYQFLDEDGTLTPRPLTLDPSRVAIFIDDAGVGIGNRTSGGLVWDYSMTTPGTQDTEIFGAVLGASNTNGVRFASPVFQRDGDDQVVVTPFILAQFAQNITRQDAEAIVNSIGAGTIINEDYVNLPGVYRIRGDYNNGYDILRTANSLAEHPDCKFAEPNMIQVAKAASFPAPNDPLYSMLWGHTKANVQDAWCDTTGNSSVATFCLGDGIELSHEDINEHAAFHIDVTPDNGGGLPLGRCERHETAVAGIISGEINNSLGAVGVAPDTQVISVRYVQGINLPQPLVCSNAVITESDWLASALSYCGNISLALGQTFISVNAYNFHIQSNIVKAACEDARQKGVLHFAAAGNDPMAPNIAYPASLLSVRAVVALDASCNLASFSSSGPGVDFAAPGVGVYTTDLTGIEGYDPGNYASFNGTSAATPFAAGVAALVLSRALDLGQSYTPQQIEAVMRMTSQDLGAMCYDTTFGFGLPQADAAVQLVGDCNGMATGGVTCFDPPLMQTCAIVNNPSLDVNGNGTLDVCEGIAACDLVPPENTDVFDLLAYLDFWFVGAQEAEWTGDSPPSIDVFDLLAFLNCWFNAPPIVCP